MNDEARCKGCENLCERNQRLKNALETERGHRQADKEEHRIEINQLRADIERLKAEREDRGKAAMWLYHAGNAIERSRRCAKSFWPWLEGE